MGRSWGGHAPERRPADQDRRTEAAGGQPYRLVCRRRPGTPAGGPRHLCLVEIVYVHVDPAGESGLVAG